MLEASSQIDPSRCPLCGQTNQCAMEIEKATGIAQEACWCVGMDFSANVLAKVPPTAQNQACICASCARLATESGM
jgi:Cysteine-rich CWC